MRVASTAEQRDLQATLGKLFRDTCATDRGRVDRGTGVAARALSALAGAGMLALPFSAELGGAGALGYETGVLFEQGGRALCPSVVYTTLLAGLVVERCAPAEQARTWLTGVMAGATTATTALWSADDMRTVRPTLSAQHIGDGVRIDGTVRFVENPHDVDFVLVSAAVDGSDQWIVAMIPPDAPGLRHQALNALGRDPLGHVKLDDCRVPSDRVIEGVSADVVHQLGEIAVALQCMEMVGGSARVLDDTVAYTRHREQFGRPIASFQAVQHIVADLRIGLDAARLSAWRAAWRIGRAEPAARAVAIAKLHCSSAYKTTTLQCHQLMGGMGFLRESDLHLWSERAKLTEIRNGSADVALGWLADSLEKSARPRT
ncbi:MAG: acyl-CoA dehydrogenase [Pseudonocardiales bacterium]|nr:acyl-CoA dehydrogenase [Pseudonocardiales bacterium]